MRGNATWRKCVDDAGAQGQYLGRLPTVSYTMSGDDCHYARVGRTMSRCALRHERIVFMGDSTMRQLFGAVACKLDGSKPEMPARRLRGKLPARRPRGRPAAKKKPQQKSNAPKSRRPGNLPKRSSDGATRLEWVVYKTAVGARAEKGWFDVSETWMFSKRFSRGTHPRFEFAPRDDRSSKNEPNRAGNDRDMRFSKVGNVSPFPPPPGRGQRVRARGAPGQRAEEESEPAEDAPPHLGRPRRRRHQGRFPLARDGRRHPEHGRGRSPRRARERDDPRHQRRPPHQHPGQGRLRGRRRADRGVAGGAPRHGRLPDRARLLGRDADDHAQEFAQIPHRRRRLRPLAAHGAHRHHAAHPGRPRDPRPDQGRPRQAPAIQRRRGPPPTVRKRVQGRPPLQPHRTGALLPRGSAAGGQRTRPRARASRGSRASRAAKASRASRA